MQQIANLSTRKCCRGSSPRLSAFSGCSVARLSRLLWEQEVAGSNPATPTKQTLTALLSGFFHSWSHRSLLRDGGRNEKPNSAKSCWGFASVSPQFRITRGTSVILRLQLAVAVGSQWMQACFVMEEGMNIISRIGWFLLKVEIHSRPTRCWPLTKSAPPQPFCPFGKGLLQSPHFEDHVPKAIGSVIQSGHLAMTVGRPFLT